MENICGVKDARPLINKILQEGDLSKPWTWNVLDRLYTLESIKSALPYLDLTTDKKIYYDYVKKVTSYENEPCDMEGWERLCV